MDDHYDSKDHNPSLQDVISLVLIYAILLTVLLLIDPLPEHGRDLAPGGAWANGSGGDLRRPPPGSTGSIQNHP